MDSRFVELSVIGSILLDQSCLDLIREKVRPEMISDEDLRRAYEAACALSDQGRPVDPVTIGGQAPDLSKSLILEAMDATPTAANADVYAEELVRSWIRRKA